MGGPLGGTPGPTGVGYRGMLPCPGPWLEWWVWGGEAWMFRPGGGGMYMDDGVVGCECAWGWGWE